MEIGSYQGIRHRRGLPLRGQRTPAPMPAPAKIRTSPPPAEEEGSQSNGQAEAGWAPPPQARAQERRRRRRPHQELVQQHDRLLRHDRSGGRISWASAGNVGFKGSRMRTPLAAQLAAEKLAKAAMEPGMGEVDVLVKGPGSGRETAIRSLKSSGLEVVRHQGRHTDPAQRLPPQEAAEGLMARYTGPVRRLCRREKMKLFLKGPKCDSMEASDRASLLSAGRPRARRLLAHARSTSSSCAVTEGVPCERPAREAVPQPLRGGQPRRRRDRVRRCCATSSCASTTSLNVAGGEPAGPRPASSSATAT